MLYVNDLIKNSADHFSPGIVRSELTIKVPKKYLCASSNETTNKLLSLPSGLSLPATLLRFGLISLGRGDACFFQQAGFSRYAGQSSRVRRTDPVHLIPLTEPYVRASYTAPVYSSLKISEQVCPQVRRSLQSNVRQNPRWSARRLRVTLCWI